MEGNSASWTEENWDPVAVAKARRAEMMKQMNKTEKERIQKHEEELKRKEEQRKKEEELKRLEQEKKEERKKLKKEKKSKEAPKQVEEKISLNYSKAELKKAKEIAREKQREADIQRNLEMKAKEMEKIAKEAESIPEIPKEEEIKEKDQKKNEYSGPNFLIIFILTFLVVAIVVRYFFVYRILITVHPSHMPTLNKLVDEIASIYGNDIVEFSELKQEGRNLFKKMYLQVNFKTFGDLARFYTSSLFKNIQSFIHQ